MYIVSFALGTKGKESKGLINDLALSDLSNFKEWLYFFSLSNLCPFVSKVVDYIMVSSWKWFIVREKCVSCLIMNGIWYHWIAFKGGSA